MIFYVRISAWQYEIDWWSGQCHGGIIALMGFCDWFDKKVKYLLKTSCKYEHFWDKGWTSFK